jgi:hypothetical protein
MENLIDRTIKHLRARRDKVLKGGVNCIPSPFKKFRRDFVGIEQKKYYLITAHEKSGKTQLFSYLFLYTALDYAYSHPEKVRLKVFYYPLEEDEQSIVLRYMSYILYSLSNKRIRISPADLESTNEEHVLSEEVLKLLETEEYQKRLKFFEEHVEFMESTNPSGVWFDLNAYADTHGKSIFIDEEYTNRDTGEIKKRKKFDHYEPDDPDEYVLIVVDHVSLLSQERNKTLRETINKLSEYMVTLRNKFHYTPVIIQQQSTETADLEAFKANKIRPTTAGLSDSKYTARDCNTMLGLVNPFKFELPTYLKYNIEKFQDNIRFLEVVIQRGGMAKGIAALFFDGATCFFSQLPKPEETGKINKYYEYIVRMRQIPVLVASMFSAIKPSKSIFNFKIFK